MKTSFNINLVQVERYIILKKNIYDNISSPPYCVFTFFTSLRYCHFGVKNLYLLVLLIKNDPTVRFEAKGGPSKDVDVFGETEEKILDMQDAEFCDEVENYVKECVQN